MQLITKKHFKIMRSKNRKLKELALLNFAKEKKLTFTEFQNLLKLQKIENRLQKLN